MMKKTIDFFIKVRYSAIKARKSFAAAITVLGVLAMGSLSNCGNDQLDLPNQPLRGLVDGNSWSSLSANAYRLPGGLQYQIRFISERELINDPCALPSPGLPHVKAIFRPAIGDFSVVPFALDNNQAQVAFEISSKSLTAVSGTMAIFDINAGTIFGYLQANLDDENTVEGSFSASFCD